MTLITWDERLWQTISIRLKSPMSPWLWGCDAIHPGYGFLSENPVLARLCSLRRIHFIGPPATIIRHMGDKVKARKKMREAGVPVIPGSKRRLPSIAQALRLANTIGYPVMLKATNGGGGARYSPLRKRRRS